MCLVYLLQKVGKIGSQTEKLWNKKPKKFGPKNAINT